MKKRNAAWLKQKQHTVSVLHFTLAKGLSFFGIVCIVSMF